MSITQYIGYEQLKLNKMNNTEKARELISKHLYLHGGDGLGDEWNVPDMIKSFLGCFIGGNNLLILYSVRHRFNCCQRLI